MNANAIGASNIAKKDGTIILSPLLEGIRTVRWWYIHCFKME
ncbi:MAG: hypothetical protein ACP5IT_05225 [Thermoproteota archaeon]